MNLALQLIVGVVEWLTAQDHGFQDREFGLQFRARGWTFRHNRRVNRSGSVAPLGRPIRRATHLAATAAMGNGSAMTMGTSERS